MEFENKYNMISYLILKPPHSNLNLIFSDENVG